MKKIVGIIFLIFVVINTWAWVSETIKVITTDHPFGHVFNACLAGFAAFCSVWAALYYFRK